MGLNLSLNRYSQNYWEELEGFLIETEFDKLLIEKGFEYLQKSLMGYTRVSGESYISHSVWVAKVISQLKIGEEAVLAALLHDCIKKNPKISIDDIATEFGDEVALLISGLTDVRQKTKFLGFGNKHSIDYFRKFLFSSVNDVRIFIIRLVEKLHDGLTIETLNKKEKRKYANQVMSVYGPVAEYVGLHYFKRLIEDIAFKILFPKESAELEKKLEEKSLDEIKALALVKTDLNKMLNLNNINDFVVEGRIKSLYSTFLKIKKKGKSEVVDRVGIRVLTESIEDCYSVLGLLHSKYKYLVEEFIDYISTPKPNGYRSIQTTVEWKGKLTVEIQIRTKEMHDFNQFGPASHIAYKLGKNNSEGKGFEWVRDLVKWQKTDKNTENYQIHVLTNYIYVFTPKGDTIQMPAASTALDFAYRIHTEIGDRCRGIKVNNKITKIDTVLKTGDMVEVLTGRKKIVSKNWLDVVKTSWAKEHIKKVTQESLKIKA